MRPATAPDPPPQPTEPPPPPPAPRHSTPPPIITEKANPPTDSFPAVANEHGPGGMLKGAEVIVRSTSYYGVTTSRGRVIDFASVPAAHIVLLLSPQQGQPSGRKRILFCSSIEYIDQV